MAAPAPDPNCPRCKLVRGRGAYCQYCQSCGSCGCCPCYEVGCPDCPAGGRRKGESVSAFQARWRTASA